MNKDYLNKLSKSRDTIKHILVLSGDIPEIENLKHGKYIIYASDGGANRLFERSIVPNYIIGDMDSIDKTWLKKYDFPTDRLVKIPEQDSNDFEKSVRFIVQQGAEAIAVFGFGGGDLEHTLNNWSVMLKFSEIIPLFVINENRMGFIMGKSFSMDCGLGDKISLIPMGSTQLSTKGLRWDLDNEVLKLGEREGASNECLGEKIEVQIHNGKLNVFVPSVFPSYYE